MQRGFRVCHPSRATTVADLLTGVPKNIITMSFLSFLRLTISLYPSHGLLPSYFAYRKVGFNKKHPMCPKKSKFSELPGCAWITLIPSSETQLHSKTIVKTMIWKRSRVPELVIIAGLGGAWITLLAISETHLHFYTIVVQTIIWKWSGVSELVILAGLLL